MQGRSGSPITSARLDWWWIFDPRCSLRARAALLAGFGTLLFALLLSWITGTLYRRTLQNQLAANFETLAFQVGDKLDRVVYERYRTLLLTTSLTPLRDPAASVSERRRVLEAIQETWPEFAWIGLTDASGRIVAASNRTVEGSTMASRSWFRGARDLPYVGPLRENAELANAFPSADSRESSNRFLDLAVPVTGINGQFAGLIVAPLRWDWSRDVQLSVVPEAATRERIGVTVYSEGREVLLDSGGTGWSQPPDAPPVGENRRFRGSILEAAANGTTYLTGYSRSRGVREFAGLGWLTTVRQPVDRALAEVASLRREIILWGGVLAVAAGVAGWILAGHHARRLRSVRAAAERIQEGDILTVLPRPKGTGETALMCEALGNLVEELRTKEEKLIAENARLAARLREDAPQS